jgi:hypothetical protein
MKEKIEGIAGLTFDARSSASLASVIEKSIEVELFDKHQSKLQTSKQLIDKHTSILEAGVLYE